MNAQTVYPTLRYQDAPAAIEWLERTLEFVRHEVYEGEGGTIAHAQLTFGSTMIMLGSASNTAGGLDDGIGPSWLYLVTDEVDAHHDRAAAAGADVVQPLTHQDYGSREYTVRDPEGNLWSVGTYQPSG